MDKFYFLDQLWRFTEDKKLVNKSGDWIFSHKNWRIPNAGNHLHPGHIRDVESGLVLGIFGNNSDDQSQVNFEVVKDQTTFTQKWIRSKPNHDGWFTLQNSGSREYLAVISSDELSTSGNIII